MQNNIRIENLQESNMDDLLYVCSSKRLSDPIHRQGAELKKKWLLEMLTTYGSCAKIAYYKDVPAAQILYYPEEAGVTKIHKRKNVLVINCVYNPTPNAQKIGIGTKLLRSVIYDVKHRQSCLGNKPCKFVLAKAFNTGEFLSMPEFYKRRGFLLTDEEDMLFLPIEGEYEAIPKTEYEPLEEDKGKAVMLYSPTCQFSYPFAKTIEEMIKKILPEIKIKIVNSWEKPKEAIKRKNWWLVVNAKPIKTFFMETEKFKEEIKRAASQNL